MEALKKENDRLNDGLLSEIQKLGLRIKADLASIQGEYLDEVSLLNQISGSFFQSIPEYPIL
jgi:hypothetical protein